MICKVEALHYRCLRYIEKELGNFHILVGPNASGKSTFLDVISFLGDIVRDGPELAIRKRTPNYNDLMWLKEGTSFELSIEMGIPSQYNEIVGRTGNCRYEIAIGKLPDSEECGILSETLWFKPKQKTVRRQLQIFPDPIEPPQTIVVSGTKRNWKKIANKVKGGNDNFYAETKGFDHAFKLGPQKSALGNLPEDEKKFPVATWVKRTLLQGIQVLMLNSEIMRKPSPPGLPKHFRTDGSNLPWVVERLFKEDVNRFHAWIEHLQTALPDLKHIKTILREEDKHRYLVLKYNNGLEVPSWGVSDGTLRMLALTILAYLPDIDGIFLIEEPENGIHPKAIETIFQSLSSVYNAQIILATHSPVILSAANIENILCFAKSDNGATDIIAGSEHPELKEWKGETPLDVLFASGVLG
ncbi:MAG TPA: ATP-binding protein [Nitrospirae bacterium]|nr:ATP-binding protein [Nitrospirota bacterium]